MLFPRQKLLPGFSSPVPLCFAGNDGLLEAWWMLDEGGVHYLLLVALARTDD